MTLEEIKEKLRRRLIDYDGNVAPHNLVDIIDDARSAGLGERDIARLLPEIDRSINWKAIKDEKQAAQEAAEQKEEAKKKAVALINTMIGFVFADGILEQSELKALFDKASTLKITSHSVAKKIHSRIEKDGYKPSPNADLKANSLRDILLSASWYDEPNYARVLAEEQGTAFQQQPQKKSERQQQSPNQQGQESGQQVGPPATAVNAMEQLAENQIAPATKIFFAVMLFVAIVFALKSWYDNAKETGKRSEINVTANNETILQNADALTQTEREKIVATLKTLYEVPTTPVSEDYMLRFQNLFNERTAHYYGRTNISRKKIAVSKRYFWNNVSGYGIDNLRFTFVGRPENYGYDIQVSGTVHYTLQKTNEFKSTPCLELVTLSRDFKISAVRSS